MGDLIEHKNIGRTIIKAFKYTLSSKILSIPRISENRNMGATMTNGVALLMLSMVKPHGAINDFKSYTVMINEQTIGHFIKTIHKVIGWFSNPDMQDLFVKVSEDDPTLIFNAKYENLFARYRGLGTVLKIVPVVAQDDATTKEGVIVYFNKLENFIILTVDDLEILYHTICNLNIAQESILLYEMHRIALLYNNIDKFDPRSFNTNFY